MTPRARFIPVALLLAPLAWARPAAADSFGGFGGREDGYLVGRDRICAPVRVDAGQATGAPACHKASADEVAQLSVKPPTAVGGKDASHEVEVHGRTLEIRDRAQDAVVVTWTALDPISKASALYVSRYANLIAVEYVVRRAGREVTEVIAFDLGGRHDGGDQAGDGKPGGDAVAVGGDAVPEASPEVAKAVKAARKAAKRGGAKAIKAWTQVLDLDPDHSEARYGVAVAQAKAKKTEAALAALEALAASSRADAIEYLVAARFDKAFAKLRAEARYRKAVGLDRPARTFYERLMGLGGTWEQAGTSCDAPGVALALTAERTFKLTITSKCSGDVYKDTFKGTWVDQEPNLVLHLPNKGKADEEIACTVARDGDEDEIRCAIDQDLQFAVKPVRR
ncbi:MAG: hypothetical protein H6709_07830 [Kofleriaceae bacterium]|nr:hypothetical protein [Myxococcales bacterium]MCB9571988.1 hypothetical protein [Kofleriaceae bacterium]